MMPVPAKRLDNRHLSVSATKVSVNAAPCLPGECSWCAV